MLKRLIEVALPLKEVSEQSAREKSIRHGHISTLHIWWARRPLAACRAVVFASLIPDPDDPACPESFRQLVRYELGAGQFRPTNSDGAAIEDTPRNRCLEFIKQLVKWENSNEPTYIDPARKLIRASHKILHPDSKDEAPKVLDPFAGGGAIPLEALRLGCEAHAIDINPVAHLIQLCTLVYPQKFGRPLSPDAPVPDYIKEAAKKSGKAEGLFGGSVASAEAEYRRNPLAADVKYWGNWVLEKARAELAEFYPPDADGSIPTAYLWARTIKCPNPACGATIPLFRQTWLSKNRKIALRPTADSARSRVTFDIAEKVDIDFDPDQGTMQQGKAACPCCGAIAGNDYVKAQSRSNQMGQHLLAVATRTKTGGRPWYRVPTPEDSAAYERSSNRLAEIERERPHSIPTEPISPQQPRVMFVTLYGLKQWNHIFNDRQLTALLTFGRGLEDVRDTVARATRDNDYAVAVATYLAVVLDRVADYCSSLSRWDCTQERNVGTFGRQCLPMVWDYAELVPTSHAVGSWDLMLPAILRVIEATAVVSHRPGAPRRGSATRLPFEDESLTAVVTDPPYYDAIPYAELSDFFYAWLKRSVGDAHPELFRSPTTPKADEIIEQRPHSSLKTRKDSTFYEKKLGEAFSETRRVLVPGGIAAVMFAHKSTGAWETLIQGLLQAGLSVSASWPLHTEGKTRLRALDSAALASSVTIICHRRASDAGEGLWDDVRRELREVSGERLDFFWSQGIRGADFFISAIGPALSVFGRYERVVRLSGEEVTVGQFLDEVRDLVTHYALGKIIKGLVGHIDPESQFYVVWKWSYGAAPVPADEAFKLAQALGFDTDSMWDATGVLEKKGQNVLAADVAKRTKIKTLGEPKADGTPASTIDVLHRMCAFRDKGDSTGAAEFLARSGRAKDETLWLVAQAVSEILPDGDKEKQLMQGLLNQRDALLRGTAKLF